MAAADSGGDERASGVDKEDGDDSPTMDGVDLGVAVVVQGLYLGPTSLDLGSMFFIIFKKLIFRIGPIKWPIS